MTWKTRWSTFNEEKMKKLNEKESAGKFDLKNTVINIVAGLGLLSFITMFCDFILLNYVSERSIVSWVFSATLHSFSLILVHLIIFKPTSWTVIFSTMIWKSIRLLQLTKTQVKQRKFEVLDKQDIMQVMSLLLQYVNHIYTI